METNIIVTQRKAKGFCMLVIFISFVFITAGFMMSFQFSKNTNPYLATDENKPDPDLYKKSGVELVDEKIVRVVSLDEEIEQINLLTLDEQIAKYEKLLNLPELKPEKGKRYKIELDHLKLNYNRLKKEEQKKKEGERRKIEQKKKEEEQNKIEEQRKKEEEQKRIEEQRKRDEEEKKRKEESKRNVKPNDNQLQSPPQQNPEQIPQYVSIGHYGINNPDLINKINAIEHVSKKKREEILANSNLTSEQKTKEIVKSKAQIRFEIGKIRLIDLNNKLKTIESDNSISAVDRYQKSIPILRQVVHISKKSSIQKVIEYERQINSQPISEFAKSEQIVKMLKDLINGEEPRLPQPEQKPVQQPEQKPVQQPEQKPVQQLEQKPDLLPKEEKAKTEDDELEKLKAEKKRLESAQNAQSEAEKLKQEIKELKRKAEKEKLLREIAELKIRKV